MMREVSMEIVCLKWELSEYDCGKKKGSIFVVIYISNVLLVL